MRLFAFIIFLLLNIFICQCANETDSTSTKMPPKRTTERVEEKTEAKKMSNEMGKVPNYKPLVYYFMG
ncbi:UNVERIFIED_CONTAM: hypothetical protein RMT77_010242 [Armadillidium vulgare]